jgi:type II secretory pathway pseudopilin PulG
MKKLVIIALAMAAATTMYAQGTINVVSKGTSYAYYLNGAGEEVRLGADFTGTLMYGGAAIVSAPFKNASNGKPTGWINAPELTSSALIPAGVLVEGFTIAVDSNNYVGESNPFSYLTGDATDPTKLPDANVVFDKFQVNYVPEPTTIALGILGLSSLLLFRRRD